ncbi:MAG: FecR domain-containing protein [Patescibacteria group bacterium]|jgi:hypothetical protein
MNRFSFLLVPLLMIGLLGSGCAQITPRLVQTPSNEQAVGSMGVLALNGGAATVTRGDKTLNAPTEVELLPGDTVRVTEGTVTIAYPGAGASYLGEGTEITLLPDGEGQGSVFAQIELAAGSIWTRFERLLGPDEKFSVSGNGVVATVRGTAFAMEIVDGQADVQVAESEVEVGVLAARKDAALAKKALLLKSGEGFTVGVQAMMRLESAGMKRLVRKLNEKEKTRKEYKKMSTTVPDDLMKMKAKTKMEGKAVIPERFRDRVDAAMMERFIEAGIIEFGAPTYAPTKANIAPTTTSR